MSYNTLQKRDDHIYYNVIITNTNDVLIPATYFENRTQPIINNCEDYYMSIIRFTIPSEQLPIIADWFNGTASTGPTGFPGGATAYNQQNGYSLTLLGTGGTASQQFIQWIPPYGNHTTAFQEQLITNYQQLVNMINIAFSTAYNVIGGQNLAPFITFNPALQLFTLFYSTADGVAGGTAGGSPINPFQIWFNINLTQLFPSFPYRLYNGAIFSYNNLGEFAQIPTVGADPLVSSLLQQGIPQINGFNLVAQEFPSTISLFEPRSLRFISGSVPCRKELIPTVNTNINSNPFLPSPPQFFGTNQGSNISGANEQAILTDFDLPLSNSVSELKPFVQYTPTAQYRYLDLKTQGPLNQFDLSILWVDQLGGIHPLYINPGQSITIKILFQRK